MTGRERELLTVQYMFCADDGDGAPRGDNLGLFDGDGWGLVRYMVEM